MADQAQQSNDTAEATQLNQKAYDYYTKCEQQIAREDAQLVNKARANRANILANLGKFVEGENIIKELHRKEPNNLFHYYNLARLYCKWGKLNESLNILDQGIKQGLIKEKELTRKDLTEDLDFDNLRLSTVPEIKRRYLSILNQLK